ncbi:uncharacterized protein LOC110986577 [Acanthaster planci]|uniref:Uncharacterized protein LOC110986577 n=1 Tax=Acanthaster planci TaxID=133434 RepID=A0A8B7ZGV6_ACAPL|nr:uncharacterized protein LOC110986577 [Acanthaster planci]
MSRFLMISLGLCLILIQVVSALPYKDQGVLETELFKRLIHELEDIAPIQTECEGNLNDLDERYRWCYGSICSYEVLNGTRLISVKYNNASSPELRIEVTDMNFNVLYAASQQDLALPLTLDFSDCVSNADLVRYRVTVSDVTGGQHITACVDLSLVDR